MSDRRSEAASQGQAERLAEQIQRGWSAAARAPRLWLLRGDREHRERLATAVEEHLVEVSAVAVGGWRGGLERPYAGWAEVLDRLTLALQHDEPEIARRFAWALVHLLPPWGRARLGPPVNEPRSGLAELALQGNPSFIHEFFQKRNVEPQMLSYVMHSVLEAAIAAARGRRGALVMLDDLPVVDRTSRAVLLLLLRYAHLREAPLVVCLSSDDDDLDRWLKEELGAPGEGPVAWERLEAAAGSEAWCPTSRQLALAGCFALPFRVAEWRRLIEATDREAMSVDELERAVAAEVAVGRLRRFADGRLGFTRVAAARRAARLLDAAEVRDAHRALLEAEESGDPFVAAWHAAEARDEAAIYRHGRLAMVRAWGLSAYDCALVHADAMLGARPADSEIDASFVHALLSYEAGRYTAADAAFERVLETPPHGFDRPFLEYLHGYNAIFGLEDFARGIEILERVVEAYRRQGEERVLAYARNSLAYALVRSRMIDEAIALEEENLELLAGAEIPDSFLASILHLNLGRIYRNTGVEARALELFGQGIENRSELTPHALLLFYATVGNYQRVRGHPRAALAAFERSLELLRDMQVDGLKDQALQALSHGAPPVPLQQLTRTDEAFFYLHAHLAAIYGELGLERHAACYRAAVRGCGELLGSSPVVKLDASETVGSPPLGEAEPWTPLALPPLILSVDTGDDLPVGAGAALADGEVVAVVRSRDPVIADERGRPVSVDSLVLYDPRRYDLAERMLREVGGSHLPGASAALLLPSALERFVGAQSLALVQQTATLRLEYRAELAALVPVCLGVRVVSPELDPFLARMLETFAENTGVPLLAAAPFHLWRCDLATTPESALHAFQLSSIDRLVLGGSLLAKAHGATAIENLLELRPRLSEEAAVVEPIEPEADPAVLIRIKRRGGYATDQMLKLHPRTRGIVELCDGTRSVAELVAQLAHDRPMPRAEAGRVGAFLRELWRQGALCFDPAEPRRRIA